MVTCPEWHVSRLIIRVIMRLNRGLCTISWHLPYDWGKPWRISTSRPSNEGPNRCFGSQSMSGREKEGNNIILWVVAYIFFFSLHTSSTSWPIATRGLDKLRSSWLEILSHTYMPSNQIKYFTGSDMYFRKAFSSVHKSPKQKFARNSLFYF